MRSSHICSLWDLSHATRKPGSSALPIRPALSQKDAISPLHLPGGTGLSSIRYNLHTQKRACEKTKVFSCVLLFLDATVAIFYKKVYNSPLPHKKSYYGILCGSCCFFLFIVILIKIVSNRNKKYFEQYRFYSSSDSPFVPTVVFYDAKCTFCLNGSVHP